MKVCDRHPDQKSVETLEFKVEGITLDMCDACRYAVLEMFSQEEIAEEPKKGPATKVIGKN